MMVLAITLSVAAVVLFLLLLGLRSPRRPPDPWALKAAIIVICGLFCAALWHLLPRLQGWPAAGPPPAEFELVSRFIVEPDKRGGAGAVYLWVIDLSEDTDRIPRAYRLPYDEQLHENIARATADGRPQKGVVVKRAGGTTGAGASDRIHFQPLPTARLPPKD